MARVTELAAYRDEHGNEIIYEGRIGDDVMFASENQVRADDGHPIFDVRTGKRVNVSRSIRPYYKPDASTVTKSQYWRMTEDDRSRPWRVRLRRAAGRIRRRLRTVRRAG